MNPDKKPKKQAKRTTTGGDKEASPPPPSASIPVAPKPTAAAKAKSAPKKQAQSATEASSPAKPKQAKVKAAKPKAAATAPPPAMAGGSVPPVSKPSAVPPVPPILLEGDSTPIARRSGPGSRYALGAATPVGTGIEELGELPEGYGTKRLSLAARDPHWLYASWDLTNEQLRTYNNDSAEGHLVVRVYRNQPTGAPVAEVHVHPESRTWFVYVGQSEARFVAELGYYAEGSRQWTRITLSNATVTPPDTLSEDTSVQFATIPSEISFKQLVSAVQEAAREHLPLVEAIRQLRAEGHTQLPEQPNKSAAKWTEAQSRALAAVLTMDQVRRVWIGSLEVTELIRRRLAKDISSMAAAQLSERAQIGALSSETLSSVSSAFGGMPGRRGFWFNVNAELIIYGATEPDATVTIGDRKIRLRKDGSFSFRFALPDGNYSLPARATSADGDDTRAAHLEFRRSTQYEGEVETHPQDPALRPPQPEHTA